MSQIKLLDENAQLRKVTGVQKFHDAGYYGSRVHAASGECWSVNDFNPDGLVSDPTGVNTGGSSHARITAATFFQVAPQATLAMFKSSGKFSGTGKIYEESGKTYVSTIMDDMFPIIDDYEITAMFTSLNSAGNDEYRADYSKAMQEHPYFCSCFSAGNDGEGTYNKQMKVEEVFGIGGFTLNDGNNKGKPTIFGLSGSGDEDDPIYVDFCAPFGAWYHTDLSSDNPKAYYATGTSLSAPWFAGMICLVNDFFIDKTGKPLTREKMRQFMIDCCYDMATEGEDYRTGWGAPCLPDPSEIDIAKYADVEEKPDPEQPVDPEPEQPTDPQPEKPEDPVEEEKDALDIYNDKDTIPEWAKPYVRRATELGLFGGDSNGNFNPNNPITRAESCVVFTKLYDLLK